MGEMRDDSFNRTFFSSVQENLNTTSDPYSYMGNSLDSVFSANRLFHISSLVGQYYTPFLCFFGAIGNCLSIAVFCFNQRNLSSSYYLSALAISDTGFLVTVFFFWLESFLEIGVLTSNFGCPFIMYSGQVTCFLSVWLTVAFTVERFFAVCSPLKRSSICTVSKAKKVICSLTTFALLAFSYALFIARVEEVTNNANTNTGIDDAGHFGKLNPGDNGTFTSNSVIEPNFTRTIHSNQERKFGEDDDLFLDVELNGGSCEGCQLQFVKDVKGDTRGDFSNKDGMNGGTEGESTTGRGAIITPTHRGPDPKSGISFPMPMFNSTMSINLNESDTYEGGNGPIQSLPEVSVRCTVPMEYVPISIYANYIDTAVTLIIPFFLITYFNMRIAICVWKLKDERRRIVAGNANHHKFGQRSTLRNKRQETTGRPKGGLSKIMRFGRPTLNKEEGHVTPYGLAPIDMKLMQNHSQRENNGQEMQICQMCGALPDGDDNSNPDFTGQIPSPQINANHSPTAHLSQQNEISCSACKSLLSQNQPRKMGTKLPIPGEYHDNFRAGGNHCSSPSTTNLKLSPMLGEDLNEKGHEEVSPSPNSNPKFKSLKRLIPNSLNEIGMSMSRRGDAGVRDRISNLRTTTTSSNSSSSSQSSEARVTKMLLLVSTSFLLLNLPSHAIRLLMFLQSLFWEDDVEVMRRLFAAQQLSNVLLFNTNFAINVGLYCLSGRNFRKSLWNVLFGRCHKKSRRSPRSKSLQKKVRILPRGHAGRDEKYTPVSRRGGETEMMEQQQIVFPKTCNKIDIVDDFETIELETTMA